MEQNNQIVSTRLSLFGVGRWSHQVIVHEHAETGQQYIECLNLNGKDGHSVVYPVTACATEAETRTCDIIVENTLVGRPVSAEVKALAHANYSIVKMFGAAILETRWAQLNVAIIRVVIEGSTEELCSQVSAFCEAIGKRCVVRTGRDGSVRFGVKA